MLKEGDQLPAFSGLNHLGDPLSHKDYSGKKLIVFFYPRANTPVSYTHLTLPTTSKV